MPDVNDLIRMFNSLFQERYETILVRGDNEPIYLVKDENSLYNQVVFAHGFFSSALHEISHWCVAGKDRRKIEDFGYWYKPDGRTAEEQMLFERVEVKPQALEWCFSIASGIPFNFSADNIALGNRASESFKLNVKKQVLNYFRNGFPIRASQLLTTLKEFYHRHSDFEEFKKSIYAETSLA